MIPETANPDSSGVEPKILPATTGESRPCGALPTWGAMVVLAVLTLGFFAELLFSSRVIASATGTDTYLYFLHWRNFGFHELLKGNLPLWNPHYGSGMPFFGGFQSALLYPLNAVFLILPVELAINWSVAIHVFLMGAFTYLWVRNQDLHPLSCLLAAIVMMFGGPYFLHIYAGHLPNLCTMVWAPLLFLAIDKVFAKPSLGACLLGIFAVTMALLAGHVQYVFYLGCAAAVYCLLNWRCVFGNPRVFVCLMAISVGPALLTAVQLLTGIQEAQEGLRSTGLGYETASTFSFPPENIFTAIAPWFFGDMETVPYWGRCFLFEMCLFMGVSTLIFAVVGATGDEEKRPWKPIIMVLVALVIALGGHTPLFHLLYDYAPGFNKFRGSSKFIFFAALFLSFLAARGVNRIMTNGLPRVLIVSTFAAAAILTVLATFLFYAPLWEKVLHAIAATQEIYPQAVSGGPAHDSARFAITAGQHAAASIAPAIAALLTLGVLLLLLNKSSRWAVALLALAGFELYAFARPALASFASSQVDFAAIRRVLDQNHGDYRIINPGNPNAAMSLNAQDIWVNDPAILRRYAEFLALTQQQAGTNLTQDFVYQRYDRLFDMLRCRYVFTPGSGGITVLEHTNALPQLLLISNYRVVTNRDRIFSTLASGDFDFHKEVILESEPEAKPTTSRGAVKLLSSTTDTLTIDAEVTDQSILLVTDTYAKGWRALPLPGSVADHYTVMPANYILRAIPLVAGHHRIRLEYAPVGFRVGKWISIVSAFMFFVALGAVVREPIARWITRFRAGDVLGPNSAFISGVSAVVHRFPITAGALPIFALVLLIYLPPMHGQFLWDDDILLTNNPLIRTSQGLFDIWFTSKPLDYVPLTMTSFWFQWRIWGLDPTGYHLVNALLHALGSVLLWRLLRMFKMPGAWLAAAIFAVHPVCVASVAWIAEQKNTLSLVFVLLSLILYFRPGNTSMGTSRPRAGLLYWLSLVAFALALASKPSAVVLPVILLGCIWWRSGKIGRVDMLRTIPFFALTIGSCFITLWIQHRARAGGEIHSDPLLVRMLGGTWSVWFYLYKTLLPINLSMIYPRWSINPASVVTWLPAVALMILAGFCLWKVKAWGRSVLFGFGYYAITLLPVLGIVDMYFLIYSRAADQWQYMSLIAPIAAVVAVVCLKLKPGTRVLVFGPVIIAFCLLTLYQSHFYQTRESLWRHTISKNPTAWAAYNNLGYTLEDQGNVKEAEDMYVLSLRHNPGYAEAHNNYGDLLQKSGRWKEALEHYAEAVRIIPNYADAHSNFGGLLLETNQFVEAEKHLTIALQLKPNLGAARYNYGILLSRTGKREEALQQFQRAISSDPTLVKAYANAGYVLLEQGKLPEAAEYYSALLRLQPDSIDGHYNLGLILAKQGRNAEAIIHFLDVVRLRPDFEEAKQQLELLQRGGGETKSAACILRDLTCG